MKKQFRNVSIELHMKRLLASPNLEVISAINKEFPQLGVIKYYRNHENVEWTVSAINEDYRKMEAGWYVDEHADLIYKSLESLKKTNDIVETQILNPTRKSKVVKSTSEALVIETPTKNQ